MITANHVLIDGHERWKAIRELGLTRYPLRVLGNLSDTERKELAIRLNVERRHLSRAERQRLLEMVLTEAPDRSTREVADLFRVNQSTVSRTRQKLRTGDANASPLVVSGRDGKTYHYPATSVENPNVARIAGRLLAELGDDAPEGGASLRTLNKKRFELERQELLGRTAPRCLATSGFTPSTSASWAAGSPPSRSGWWSRTRPGWESTKGCGFPSPRRSIASSSRAGSPVCTAGTSTSRSSWTCSAGRG